MRTFGRVFLIVLLITLTARAVERTPATTANTPAVAADNGNNFVPLRSDSTLNTQKTRSRALRMFDTYGGYCYVLDAHYFTRDGGDQVRYRTTTTYTPASRIQLKHADINGAIAR
jgi:hypothetical protein